MRQMKTRVAVENERTIGGEAMDRWNGRIVVGGDEGTGEEAQYYVVEVSTIAGLRREIA
jgi:hypothetical protein